MSTRPCRRGARPARVRGPVPRAHPREPAALSPGVHAGHPREPAALSTGDHAAWARGPVTGGAHRVTLRPGRSVVGPPATGWISGAGPAGGCAERSAPGVRARGSGRGGGAGDGAEPTSALRVKGSRLLCPGVGWPVPSSGALRGRATGRAGQPSPGARRRVDGRRGRRGAGSADDGSAGASRPDDLAWSRTVPGPWAPVDWLHAAGPRARCCDVRVGRVRIWWSRRSRRRPALQTGERMRHRPAGDAPEPVPRGTCGE